MKKWFNKGVKQFLKHRYHRIEDIRVRPFEIQENVLKSLLKRARNTEYGKEFEFSDIKSISDFSKRLPLTDYEDLKPGIYKMLNGEKNILWPGKVKWFAKSSGTTGERSKYIPVSDDAYYKNYVSASWDTMSIVYHEDPDCDIFHKKSLIMGGAINPWKGNPSTLVGDISAIVLDRMPAVGRPFYSPDFEVAFLEDWEEKIELMTKLCTKEDIVMFGGVPTWTIVLFKRILDAKGAEDMHEIWPNVRYYFHGGVGFDPYVEQFKQFFPDPAFRYYEVYNASEGYFSVQDRFSEKGMLLLLNSDVFYEFVTMHELVSEQPETITLKEVEIGKNYAIIISSSAGLWRYMPGDTVIFTSILPFRIKVSGRTKHFINVFGEEVMVGNTDKALAETIKALPARVSEYTVAPVFMGNNSKGGHQWLIEFERAPDNLEAFEILLDDNLQKLNSDYEAKRHKDMALSRLEIKSIPRGTFHRWLAEKGKMGGQNKVPRLYNNRKYADELLTLLN